MKLLHMFIVLVVSFISLYYATYKNRIAGLFAKYLKECNSLMQIGSGDGCFAQFLSNRVQVTAYDIMDNSTGLCRRPIIFDGERVPESNHSHDMVIAMFTLHNSGNQTMLLDEMWRIANKYVVVLEDVLEKASKPYIENRIANGDAAKYKSYCKTCYHSINEWRDMFRVKNMPIVEERILPAYFCPFANDSYWYPVRKVMFVLKKTV